LSRLEMERGVKVEVQRCRRTVRGDEEGQ
jgi:hypothetical protein